MSIQILFRYRNSLSLQEIQQNDTGGDRPTGSFE